MTHTLIRGTPYTVLWGTSSWYEVDDCSLLRLKLMMAFFTGATSSQTTKKALQNSQL